MRLTNPGLGASWVSRAIRPITSQGKLVLKAWSEEPALRELLRSRLFWSVLVLKLVLGALFAVSFWWDFDGMAVGLFGQTVAVEGLLKVLTVSGLIGFGTNWLAITMLFQPREKRAIIPQGLIPAQRERVIYRLSEAISRELINADIIKQKIKDSGVIGRYRDLALGVVRGVVEDPGFRADLKDLAQAYATEVLGSEAVRREVRDGAGPPAE